SYNGQTQLEIMSQKPKHLTAAYIGKTDFNKYDGWVRNGVPRAFGSQPDFLWSDDEEEAKSQLEGLASVTVPVDEDPEGILLRQAIWEHRGNGLQIPMLRDLNWRDSVLEELGGKVWEELSASTYHREMNESGVAVYLDGGCYDVFRRDTFVLYRNLALPRKMIFGPWYHIGPKSDPEPWVEMLRWFDYWLKGIENGIVDEAPLALKMASYDFRNSRHQGEGTGEYRMEWNWPAEIGHRETWYLDAAGTMGVRPGETGECPYEVVYGIQSSMESGTTIREDGQGIEQRGMVFTSEPLTENREIIGHPMAYLSFILENRGWMEKEKADLDFFVILADWDPESETSYQISEGHLRASERENLADCPYDFLGLPWYENREGSNRYLKEGEIYHLTFDLLPLCYRVKKGHRLKMIISNSLDRMYYSGRLPYEQGKTEPAPVIRLLCGGEEDSRLVLPNIYQN
ncbi:MAG: hypothetical protein LUC27_04045, partial [Lachnospiraceae bacterium]|nr:hypothetical protein [Lachnospiraceae bacterium]